MPSKPKRSLEPPTQPLPPTPPSPPSAPPPEAESKSPTPQDAPKAESTEQKPPETSETGVGIEQAMYSMGFGDAPEPIPAVPEPSANQNAPEGTTDAPKAASEKPATAPEAEKKAKPADAPPEPVEEEDETPQIDLDAIREAVREGVSSGTKSAEPAKAAETKPTEPQLSPSRRDTLEVAKFMESTMDEYRGSGLQGQLQRYWAAEDAHKKAWLKDNPGKRYRSDDEEHNDFYATNPMPDYSPDDFTDAQVLKRQQEVEGLERRHKEELAKIKFEAESSRHETEIRDTANRAVADLYVNAPDQVKTALTVDGKLTINQETMEKLEVEEPVFAERLKHHGQIVGGMIEELERLTRFPEHVKADPAGNPVHRHIFQFADNLETYLLSRPKSETTVDGKQFLAQDDYMQRAEQIRNSTGTITQKNAQLTTLKNKFYFADASVIRTHLVRSAAQQAAAEAKQIEDRLSKSPKYARPATASSGDGPKNGTPAPAPRTSDGRDVRPPSPTVSTSDRTDASKADPQNIKSRDAAIDQAMGW